MESKKDDHAVTVDVIVKLLRKITDPEKLQNIYFLVKHIA